MDYIVLLNGGRRTKRKKFKMNLLKSTRDEVLKELENGNLNACVIGLGRVGLPTAAVLADSGVNVIGADISSETVNIVNSGRSKYDDEPGLPQLVKKTVNQGKLRATTEIASAVSKSDFIIVCVPTPVDEKKIPDYSAIIDVSKIISNNVVKGSIVIIESTVGPGTVENLIIPLIEQNGLKAGKDFGVASCPERANPGEILHSLRTVPRIVGGIDWKTVEAVTTFYEAVFNVEIIKVSDLKTANAVKLTENIFRDTNIALMNELAILYEKLGIDVIKVIEACTTKWNFAPHYPGPGVGGPCLPANPYYMIHEGVKVGYIPYLIRMAREVNDRMPEHVIKLITEALNEVKKHIKGSKIALLGVSYKADVRDLQMTPIKQIFNPLKKMGAKISFYDPYFRGENIFHTKSSSSYIDAVKDADCIVIGTAHKEFAQIDLEKIAKEANMPAAIVDAKAVFSSSDIKNHGFSFRGIGRI